MFIFNTMLRIGYWNLDLSLVFSSAKPGKHPTELKSMCKLPLLLRMDGIIWYGFNRNSSN